MKDFHWNKPSFYYYYHFQQLNPTKLKRIEGLIVYTSIGPPQDLRLVLGIAVAIPDPTGKAERG